MLDVSVIIPAYNAEGTLRRAVDSCLQQYGASFEILIIENNSGDGTLELAQSLADTYPEVKVSREHKQGAAAARNQGLALAGGKYVQFLDADDFLIKGKWVRQLELLRNGANWLTGAFIDRGPDGREQTVVVDNCPWRAILHTGGIGCMNSNLYKRNLLLKHRGMDENLPDHEDYDLYFRLLSAGEHPANDQIAGAYYTHDYNQSLSRVDSIGYAARRVQLTERIIAFIKSSPSLSSQIPNNFLKAVLLSHLRLQATVDKESAFENANRYFLGNFRSIDFDRSITPFYFPLYTWFGFERVESVRIWVGRTIPPGLRRLLN